MVCRFIDKWRKTKKVSWKETKTGKASAKAAKSGAESNPQLQWSRFEGRDHDNSKIFKVEITIGLPWSKDPQLQSSTSNRGDIENSPGENL